MASAANAAEPIKYARFQIDEKVAYGIIDGEAIREISGDLFGDWKETSKTHPLKSVKLLVPTEPSKVIALAGNYKSHLKDAEPDPRFDIPQPFFKAPSCLIAQGESIVIPPGTAEVHYEAELVVVIGKRAKDVSPASAPDYIFGVTCGNDISARDWQKNDVQWWHAKGSDTFGPCGPFILSGVDYNNLWLTLRLNGETKQRQNTKDQIQNIVNTVSFISKHVTLNPGDLIFTGTPGKTSPIQPGDVVEVELEKTGLVLRNKVVAKN
jgi:2-keto-4-pentenoate hydratase/2-oxohepta-3-ene-1,7-dioic acid hydratase in catechol pathway